MRVLSNLVRREWSVFADFFYKGVFTMFVYISGAITNNENYEKQFMQAEKDLRRLGYNVVNPVSIGKRLEKELGRTPIHAEYLQKDLMALKNCDAIYQLPGWEKSKGAKIEYKYAVGLGKTFIKYKMLSPKWD